MQQPPQPRPYDLLGAFRPQHGCDHVAPDRTLRFGQIDQQRQAFAQRQPARLVVPTDLRKSKRLHAEPSHRDPIRNDGPRGRPGDAAMLAPRAFDRRRNQWRPIKRGHRGSRTNTWENLMIGRIAALIYGIASYLVFLSSLSLRGRFHRQLSGAEVDRRRTRERACSVDPDRRGAARLVRGPTQRHGASGLQALVDDDRPGVLRAQHLCADLEPAPDPHLLAVAADRHDDLARGGLAGGPVDGDLLDRLADGADVDVHDRSFRAVRIASGIRRRCAEPRRVHSASRRRCYTGSCVTR